jgi:hypothetical protein
MAWSEDDVVESRSITIVDITAKGEVAPPVPVEIDDEEAQLEVDDAERGDIVAVRIKNFINAGIFLAIIKGVAFKDLKKMTSFLNQCGMRLIDKDKSSGSSACWTRASMSISQLSLNAQRRERQTLAPTSTRNTA